MQSRVVDQHVDGTELFGDGIQHGRHARRIGDVGGHGGDAELARDAVGALLVARGDRHAGAGLAQGARVGQAEATVAARDDGDLAVEAKAVKHGHVWLLGRRPSQARRSRWKVESLPGASRRTCPERLVLV